MLNAKAQAPLTRAVLFESEDSAGENITRTTGQLAATEIAEVVVLVVI